MPKTTSNIITLRKMNDWAIMLCSVLTSRKKPLIAYLRLFNLPLKKLFILFLVLTLWNSVFRSGYMLSAG